LPKELAWTDSLIAVFFISSMTESWISLSLSETLGCSKISRGRRHSADLTSLGRTCLINESGFLPYFVLNSNFPIWSLFPYLSDKSFQVSSDGYWTLVSTGRYRVIKKHVQQTNRTAQGGRSWLQHRHDVHRGGGSNHLLILAQPVFGCEFN